MRGDVMRETVGGDINRDIGGAVMWGAVSGDVNRDIGGVVMGEDAFIVVVISKIVDIAR
jgi:hypothetical protein